MPTTTTVSNKSGIFAKGVDYTWLNDTLDGMFNNIDEPGNIIGETMEMDELIERINAGVNTTIDPEDTALMTPNSIDDFNGDFLLF